MTDLNARARENMGRILLVVVGALLFNLGNQLWYLLPPGGWAAVVLLVYVYGTGLGLLVLALVDIDLEKYGRAIAFWCAFLVVAGAVAVLLLMPGSRFGTDALLFSRYSVDLFLAGQNPFAHSMAPAAERYSGSILHVTPQTDGSYITSLSYPAGMIWWFVPQALADLGQTNLAGTLLVVVAAVFAFLILESPATISLLPVIIMIGSRNLVWAATGGILDVLWVLPLLLSMREWHADRYARAALLFGLAAGTKQTVWPISAALAIWLWQDADSVSAFRSRSKTCLGYGAAGFLVLNGPFVVWNPSAWATSVLTPINNATPMIHQGVGPTLFSVAGLYALPKTYYSLLVVSSFGTALGLYWLHWERAKWTAWLLPPVVLFWYYRSLNSYFTWFLPIAYYALLLHLDLRRTERPIRDRVTAGLTTCIAALVASIQSTFVSVPERSQDGGGL